MQSVWLEGSQRPPYPTGVRRGRRPVHHGPGRCRETLVPGLVPPARRSLADF